MATARLGGIEVVIVMLRFGMYLLMSVRMREVMMLVPCWTSCWLLDWRLVRTLSTNRIDCDHKRTPISAYMDATFRVLYERQLATAQVIPKA